MFNLSLNPSSYLNKKPNYNELKAFIQTHSKVNTRTGENHRNVKLYQENQNKNPKTDSGRNIGGEENHKYGTIDGGQKKRMN
jgi:hypothetical protein